MLYWVKILIIYIALHLDKYIPEIEQAMSNHRLFTNDVIMEPSKPEQGLRNAIGKRDFESNHMLPTLITKAASKQTYYTIRFLVDRDRVLDAYRAYAYFRWVDDSLDEKLSAREERIAFLERQQALMNCCYQNEWLGNLSAEESILTDLIQSDSEPHSGLQFYIRNMMAVMAFDADRRGRLISQHELTKYSGHLSNAVTEALHYFIGHDVASPRIPTRYLAVTGAHITHMLRDAFEDASSGYFNIPCEFLDAHKLDPCDIYSDAFRMWVKNRVQLARSCFKVGKGYLAQVKNRRCRIAGYAYTARFEQVLNTIENEDFYLRSAYSERKSLRSGLRMSWSILSMMLKDLIRGTS
jgi:phytoene/squalene synthetase